MLYYLLFTLASLPAMGQESGWMTEDLTAENSLIRHRDASEAVAYYESGNRGYFLRISTSGIVARMKLDASYHVKDFCITEQNTVCFCGYYGNNSYGILGYFDLNDLTAGNLSVSTPTIKVLETTQINRIVAYKTAPLAYQMVSVAESSYVVPPYRYRISKLVMYNTGAQYYKVYVQNTGACIFNDIVETSNKIAILGVDLNVGTDNIAIWQFRKSAPLPIPINQELIYSTTNAEVASVLHACPMNDDRVAVAYLFNGADDNTPVTHICYFDISNNTMFNAQEFRLSTKAEPVELTYLTDSNYVVILQGYNDDDEYNQFIYLDPDNPNTYRTNVLFSTTYRWESLDYAENSRFVASDGCTWYIKDNSGGRNPAVGACYSYGNTDVNAVSTANALLTQFGLMSSDHTVSTTTLSCSIDTPTITNTCVHN